MATLALLVFLRVMGVFLVLVGFSEHWRALGGSDATSGVGFGAYALALALFLLPLGALSDRVGRRTVIVGALLVSALGGVMSAFAPTAWLFAAGRFVQGAGAINGVALALAGEIGAPDARTRRMAVLGAAAGAGVVAGLLASAGLARAGVTIPQILIAFSAATVLSVPLAWRTVPTRSYEGAYDRIRPLAARSYDPRARRRALALGVAAFAVNFSLAGLLLESKPLLARAAPGLAYELALLVMLLPAGIGMFVAARFADRGYARAVGLGAAALLGFAPLAFLGVSGAALVLVAGVAFFLGHSSLSSLLPALASRDAAEGARGAAQGLQSTLQYLGAFAGPSVMAWLFAHGALAGMGAAFVASGLVVALVIALSAGAGQG